MKRVNFNDMTVDQLVEHFAAIALEQDEANLFENYRKYNRLYDRMKLLEQELKSRSGDQRRALLPLCDHQNAQVRLKAAFATLAVAPERGRQTLQTISDRNEYPEAGDARETLRNIEQGHKYS